LTGVADDSCTLLYALGAGVGLTLALVIMAGIREEAELSTVPQLVRGTTLSFFIASILSMAFMSFACNLAQA